MTYEIKIIPSADGPAGKLADAEIHFAANHVPFAGMKLIGFSIWRRRDGARNVTMPARTYSVNGERRSFALLRPAATTEGQDLLKAAILAAYDEHETAEPPIADAYNPNDAVSAARDRGKPDPLMDTDRFGNPFRWAPDTTPAPGPLTPTEAGKPPAADAGTRPNYGPVSPRRRTDDDDAPDTDF